jgi:hypothetical protein
MKMSTFDSLVPYPQSATGYHLSLSQNPIACDVLGIPKNTVFTVTVYRKTGANSMELARGVYISVCVGFPGYSSTYKSESGTITVSLVDSSSPIPRYADALQVWVGESSHAIHDIADMSVSFTCDGKQGDTGRLPVPYGEYSSTTTYTATAAVAPYVLCGGKYYVMNKTASVKGLNPQADYAANGTKATWILLEGYKAVFAELLMANLGLIGKAVFYNEYQYSQYGRNGSTFVWEEGKYGVPVDAGGTFVPNLLMNFLTGEIRSSFFSTLDFHVTVANVDSLVDSERYFYLSKTGYHIIFEYLPDNWPAIFLERKKEYAGVEISIVITALTSTGLQIAGIGEYMRDTTTPNKIARSTIVAERFKINRFKFVTFQPPSWYTWPLLENGMAGEWIKM